MLANLYLNRLDWAVEKVAGQPVLGTHNCGLFNLSFPALPTLPVSGSPASPGIRWLNGTALGKTRRMKTD
jgi:hypothetical protein